MDQSPNGQELSRGLKNRHIQLIAIGGAIGTGLSLVPENRYTLPARLLCSYTS